MKKGPSDNKFVSHACSRSTRKKAKFDPGHGEVHEAVQEFLQNGGKITKTVVSEDDYIVAMLSRTRGAEADDFLNGV